MQFGRSRGIYAVELWKKKNATATYEYCVDYDDKWDIQEQ